MSERLPENDRFAGNTERAVLPMKLKELFIVLGLVAGLFLTAEGILRIAAPLSSEQPTPVFILKQDIPGLKERIVYQRNRFGFRSLSMSEKTRPSGTVRILCLGASTTDQPVQSAEDTWWGILEQKLKSPSGPRSTPVEVASFAHGGWKASNILSWARSNMEVYAPDIVVVMLGINDLAFNGGPDYAYSSIEDRLLALSGNPGDLEGAFAEGSGASRPSLLEKCGERFQLCRRALLARRSIFLWRQKRSGTVFEWHSSALPEKRREYRNRPYVESLSRNPDPIEEFGDALRSLLRLLEKNRVETVVLEQPVLWKEKMTPEEVDTLWFSVNTREGPVRPSGAWLLREMQRYNDLQERVAAGYGATFVHLDKVLPKSLKYYFDDCHYTDLGSAAIAEILYPIVHQKVEEVQKRKGIAGEPEPEGL